jgi:hypothetical protein
MQETGAGLIPLRDLADITALRAVQAVLKLYLPISQRSRINNSFVLDLASD